jgi:hypothetical protein
MLTPDLSDFSFTSGVTAFHSRIVMRRYKFSWSCVGKTSGLGLGEVRLKSFLFLLLVGESNSLEPYGSLEARLESVSWQVTLNLLARREAST